MSHQPVITEIVPKFVSSTVPSTIKIIGKHLHEIDTISIGNTEYKEPFDLDKITVPQRPENSGHYAYPTYVIGLKNGNVVCSEVFFYEYYPFIKMVYPKSVSFDFVNRKFNEHNQIMIVGDALFGIKRIMVNGNSAPYEWTTHCILVTLHESHTPNVPGEVDVQVICENNNSNVCKLDFQ